METLTKLMAGFFLILFIDIIMMIGMLPTYIVYKVFPHFTALQLLFVGVLNMAIFGAILKEAMEEF